jgi:hypothetical protein
MLQKQRDKATQSDSSRRVPPLALRQDPIAAWLPWAVRLGVASRDVRGPPGRRRDCSMPAITYDQEIDDAVQVCACVCVLCCVVLCVCACVWVVVWVWVRVSE